MIPEYQERIALRLSPGHRKEIEQLVKEGTYKNLSEFVRIAIEELLNLLR